MVALCLDDFFVRWSIKRSPRLKIVVVSIHLSKVDIKCLHRKPILLLKLFPVILVESDIRFRPLDFLISVKSCLRFEEFDFLNFDF